MFRKYPTSCRLARVLLDDLVRHEEEHGPDETLHRHDELSDPLVLHVPTHEPGETHGLKVTDSDSILCYSTCMIDEAS
jgi:hypothetical protein